MSRVQSIGIVVAVRVENATFRGCSALGLDAPSFVVNDEEMLDGCEVQVRLTGNVLRDEERSDRSSSEGNSLQESDDAAASSASAAPPVLYLPVKGTSCDPGSPDGRGLLIFLGPARRMFREWPQEYQQASTEVGITVGKCLAFETPPNASLPETVSTLIPVPLAATRAPTWVFPTQVPTSELFASTFGHSQRVRGVHVSSPGDVVWGFNNVTLLNDLPKEFSLPMPSELLLGVQAAGYAAAVASVFVPGGATTAAQIARIQSIHSIMKCEAVLDSDDLTFEQSPTRLSFGPAGFEAVHPLIGAAIGNTAVMSGLLVLHFLVGVAAMAIKRTRSFRVGFGAVAFPGFLFTFVMFLLQPTIAVSIRAVQHLGSNVTWALALVACLIYWLGVAIAIYFFVIVPFSAVRAVVVTSEAAFAEPLCSFSRLYEGSGAGEWTDKLQSHELARKVQKRASQLPENGAYGAHAEVNVSEITSAVHFVDRFGALFDEYRNGCHTFVLIEVCFSIACGVVEAVDPVDRGACKAIAATLAVLFIAFFAAFVVHRPFAAPVVLLLSFAVVALQAVGAAAAAVYVLTGDSTALELGAYLPLAAGIITYGKAAFDLFVTILKTCGALYSSHFVRKRENFIDAVANQPLIGAHGSSAFEPEQAQLRIEALRRMERKALADQELFEEVTANAAAAEVMEEIPIPSPLNNNVVFLGGASPRHVHGGGVGGGGIIAVTIGSDAYLPPELRGTHHSARGGRRNLDDVDFDDLL